MRKPKVKQLREVRVKDLILYFVLPLVGLILIWILFFLNNALQFIPLDSYIILIIVIILSYIMLRYLALGSVLMYKAFAPLDVRGRCRFEPTCSTYMMIAVRKYGLIIGITMGIRRILRCKPPNGGIDYPQLFKKKEKNKWVTGKIY